MAKGKDKDKMPPTTKPAAVAAKATIDARVYLPTTKKRNAGKTQNLDGVVQALLKNVTDSMDDNSAHMRLLPDIKLVMRVLVASILSPKDLLEPTLNFTAKSPDTSKELPAGLLNEISEYFTTDEGYNLLPKLQNMLEEALFKVGSFTLLTLPESTIVDLVQETKAYTAARNNLGLESYGATTPVIWGNQPGTTKMSNLGTLYSDKGSRFRLPELIKRDRSNSTAKSYGMESFSAPGIPMRKVGNSGPGENDESTPLVKIVPADCVLPIVGDGEPRGYMLLTSRSGSFVSRTKSDSAITAMRKELLKQAASSALGNLMRATGMETKQTEVLERPEELLAAYSESIDAEILEQLETGGGEAGELSVSASNEVYALMLTRALAGIPTVLMFVPPELVTYYAFDKNKLGIGVSILEETKDYGLLRATLMISMVMSSIKNGVGHSKLSIELDDDDPDAPTTIDQVMQNHAGYQVNLFHDSFRSFPEIAESLQRAGVELEVTGGDTFPGTKSSLEDASRDHQTPDTDLLDTLRRWEYSGWGVQPEMIDSTLEGELATSVVSRSTMFAKTVIGYASISGSHLSHFVRYYIFSSGKLIKKIKEEYPDEEDRRKFINSIEVKHPMPDLVKIKAQSDALEEYTNLVESVTRSAVSEDMLSELMDGDIDASVMESIRNSFSSAIIRDWIKDQNILPEVHELFSSEGGEVLTDRITGHNETLMKIMGKVITKLSKTERKVGDKIDKARNPPEPEEEPTPEQPSTEEPTSEQPGPEEPGLVGEL